MILVKDQTQTSRYWGRSDALVGLRVSPLVGCTQHVQCLCLIAAPVGVVTLHQLTGLAVWCRRTASPQITDMEP